MHFLVRLEYALPQDMSAKVREELLQSETLRGEQLAEMGALRAIWRIPGRRGNYGLWAAQDATQLHEMLSSLPLWPYATITVTALARHPLADKCGGLPVGLGSD